MLQFHQRVAKQKGKKRENEVVPTFSQHVSVLCRTTPLQSYQRAKTTTEKGVKKRENEVAVCNGRRAQVLIRNYVAYYHTWHYESRKFPRFDRGLRNLPFPAQFLRSVCSRSSERRKPPFKIHRRRESTIQQQT